MGPTTPRCLYIFVGPNPNRINRPDLQAIPETPNYIDVRKSGDSSMSERAYSRCRDRLKGRDTEPKIAALT
jgi:hypothetical protein